MATNDLLRGWIAPLVDIEFEAAYNVLEPRYSGEPVVLGRFSSQPGSVRVHHTTPKYVQLFQIIRNGRQLTVSDSVAKIRATFSVNANGFDVYPDRKFPKTSIGGILVIKDYWLVYNSNYTDHSNKIVLQVDEFELIAENKKKVPLVGYPTAIENVVGLEARVPAVLRKLDNVLAKGGEPMATQRDASVDISEPEISSTIRSRADDADAEADSSFLKGLATQAALLTQLPEEHARPHIPINEEPTPAAGITRTDRLLSLLSDAANIKKSNNLFRQIPQEVFPPSSKPALRPVTSARMPEVSLNSGMSANITQIQPSDYPRQSSQVAESRDNHPANHKTIVTTLQPNDSEKENSLTNKKAKNEALSAEPEALNILHEARIPLLSFVDEAADSFEGLKRVPRVYVKVSEMQQALLGRDDSWIYSEPKSRSSYANLPSKVLDDLRSFIARNIARRSDIHDSAASQVHSSEEGGLQDKLYDDSAKIGSPPDESDDESAHISTQSPIEVGKEHSHQHLGIDAPLDDSDEDAVSWAPSYSDLNDRDRDLESGIQQQIPENAGFDIHGVVQAYGKDSSNTPGVSSIQKPQTALYDFPPSSLNGEDELEQDVPHAIGDDINEIDAEMADAFYTSQELPSTAKQFQQHVQVEQTPFHHHQKNSVSYTHERHRVNQAGCFDRINNYGTHTSSDIVIPATLQEVSSQERSSTREDQTTAQKKVSTSMLSKQEDSIAPPESPTGLEISGNRVYMSQEDVVQHSQLSQHTPKTKQSLLPAKDGNVTSPKQFPYSTKHLEVDRSQTPQRRNTSELGSSPPTRDRSAEYTTTAANAALPESLLLPKRGLEALVSDAPRNPVKRRKLEKPVEFSQTDYATKDTSEIARARRRAFQAQLVTGQVDTEASAMEIATSPPREKPQEKPDSVFEIPDSLGDSSTGDTALAVSQVSTADNISQLHGKSTPILNAAVDESGRSQIDDEPAMSPDADIASIPNAYEKFKLAYPLYEGTEKQFIHALTYLDWLGGDNEKKKAFLRKSLWDDFIRTLSAEYKEHVRSSREKGKPCLTGLQFYIEQDEEPIFTSRIITSDNLKQALASLDPTEASQWRNIFRGPKKDEPQSAGSTPYSTQQQQQSEHKPLKQQSTQISARDVNLEPDKQASERSGEKASTKGPFFRTHSQALVARRTLSDDLEIQVDRTPTTIRLLPQTKTGTPEISSTVIPKTTQKSGQVSMSIITSASTKKRPNMAESQRNSVSRPQQQSSPVIIGDDSDQDDEEVFKSIPKLPLKRISSTISNNNSNRLSKRPSIAPRKSSTPSSTNVSTPQKRKSSPSVEKVKIWLADQNAATGNKLTFKDFLRKKRKSGEFEGKGKKKAGICTKPIEEPQTQAWEF